jgi:hypothetical protein
MPQGASLPPERGRFGEPQTGITHQAELRRPRSRSLTIRSKVSPADLMWYCRSLPSGGKSRMIVYAFKEPGTPL